jgi:hypothetical protein
MGLIIFFVSNGGTLHTCVCVMYWFAFTPERMVPELAKVFAQPQIDPTI